jgi:hypothetical protein
MVLREDWKFPDRGSSAEESLALAKILKELRSPYAGNPPPICYPGTTLSRNILGHAKKLLSHQLNLIGVHTLRGESEGGFAQIQGIEREAVYMLASIMGGTPDTVDGYFCSGGTEANIQGLWIGRDYLDQFPDPERRGIVVFASELVHYSIEKACNILAIGRAKRAACNLCGNNHVFVQDPRGSGLTLVPTDKNTGKMSISAIKELFEFKYKQGFRKFCFVPTLGTTVLGTLDPVSALGAFIRDITDRLDVHCYMHVDASFGGFTVPFVSNDVKFGFDIEEVCSIALDGDKMGKLPYPGGVFLCRKGLFKYTTTEVDYIKGHCDVTVSGSRSGLAPAIAWYMFRNVGMVGQRRYIQKCLDKRDYLFDLIREKTPWIRIAPHSKYTNFAPLIFGNEIKSPEILAPYELRSGNWTEDQGYCPIKVFKLCIMPHTFESANYLEKFVEDLKKASK